MKKAHWTYDDDNSSWLWESPLGTYCVSAWDASASGPLGVLGLFDSIKSAKRACVVHCRNSQEELAQ